MMRRRLAIGLLALAGVARPEGVAPLGAAQLALFPDVVVLPFENAQMDPRLHWLAEGAAVLMTENAERRGLRTLDRDERLDAFERLRLPPAAALSHATVIRIGQAMAAGEVVIGSYERDGEALVVRARALRLDAGRLSPEIVERGSLADLMATFDRAAGRLWSGRPAVGPPARANLQAFELYVKGLIAETPAAQLAFLQQAQQAAPDDALVRLALARAHAAEGRHAEAIDAARAVPASSRWSREARYGAALSLVALARYAEAFDELRALQAESRSAAAANLMGVVQLARGGDVASGRATYYFHQAAELDGEKADYFFNLGYAYARDGDAPAAIYWLREAVRRDPADRDAHAVLAAALEAAGAAAEAARERDLLERLGDAGGAEAVAGARAGEIAPPDLERLTRRLDRPGSRVQSTLAAAGRREQAELARFHVDAARRALAREAETEAERELRRALFLSPYMAEAHLLLGRIQLRRGHVADAVQTLKIAVWSAPSAEAHVALAEALLAADDEAAADEEIDKALALDPASPDARALRARGPAPPQ